MQPLGSKFTWATGWCRLHPLQVSGVSAAMLALESGMTQDEINKCSLAASNACLGTSIFCEIWKTYNHPGFQGTRMSVWQRPLPPPRQMCRQWPFVEQALRIRSRLGAQVGLFQRFGDTQCVFPDDQTCVASFHFFKFFPICGY